MDSQWLLLDRELPWCTHREGGTHEQTFEKHLVLDATRAGDFDSRTTDIAFHRCICRGIYLLAVYLGFPDPYATRLCSHSCACPCLALGVGRRARLYLVWDLVHCLCLGQGYALERLCDIVRYSRIDWDSVLGRVDKPREGARLEGASHLLKRVNLQNEI